MEYIKKDLDKVDNDAFYEKVRNSLKLTKSQLPDKKIREVLKINGRLIGEWIVNNPDGFKIKDNGILIVSKWLPKCFRGDKAEKLEELMNDPLISPMSKKMIKKKYDKAVTFYKAEGEKRLNLNMHSFFYLYRIIWMNDMNCSFEKAKIYQLEITKATKAKLTEKILNGFDYFEWQFSDFRERKKKQKEEKRFNDGKLKLEKDE